MLKWNITAGARFNSFIINVEDQELGADEANAVSPGW